MVGSPSESPTPSAAASPPGGRPWLELARLVGIVLAAVAVVGMVGRLGDVVGLVLLAAAMALITDPVRRRLARRIPPGAAIVVTALLSMIVIITLAVVLFRDLSAQSARLSEELLDRVRSLRPGTLPARVADSLDATEGIDDGFSRLPSVVVAGEENVTGVGRQLIDMLLVVILAAFFQSGAAGLLDWVAARWPRAERKDVRDLVSDIEIRGGGYVRRVVLLGGLAAAVIAGTAFVTGIDGAAVLGTWAGVCLTVPAIGWLVGLAPAVAAGFATGPGAGLVVLAVAVAVALVVGLTRRRLVERCRVRPGPALSALSLAVGFVAAGFGGVLVAFVLTGLAVAALTSPRALSWPSPEEPGERSPKGADRLVQVAGGGVRIAPGWRGALTVIGAASIGMLVWTLTWRVGHVALWFVIGGLVAVALSRPVAWSQRWLRLPRTAAVALVFSILVAVGGAATLAGIAGGASTSSELAQELPSIVTDLESTPVIGPWLRDRDAAVWVSDQMTNLPERLQEARDVGAWLPTVGARMLDLFWTALLALALLLDGPRLVAALERRVPADRRRQFARGLDVSRRALAGYLAGAALVAAINASVVFTIALVLGIALAPVLAIWAFVWNFVPQIGGFMGGFPLVVLALAAGPMQAILAGVLFVVYQFVENHLIQPAVIAEAIDVPPWATLLAALAGGAAAGVIGAVVLTPLVGVVRVVLAERRRADFPGATVPGVSLDDPTSTVDEPAGNGAPRPAATLA